MTKLLLLFTVFLCLNGKSAFASSCEKNNTCKHRFEFQGDPLDLERESSRAHSAIFFTFNFAVNRFLQSPLADSYVGKLSKNERILYTAAALFAAGFVKELAYDPDGVSNADLVSNLMGIGLAIPIEISFF
ncbi:MAG: hypothetical protein ACOYL6_11155 [Bacteriovoracaceae bacterium]